MTALYIILGIIAFICLVLLVKVRIDAEYIDGFKLSVSWLFLHFSIYPKTQKEKKPPKPKKEKPARIGMVWGKAARSARIRTSFSVNVLTSLSYPTIFPCLQTRLEMHRILCLRR